MEDSGLSHGIEINASSVKNCFANCKTWLESVMGKVLLNHNIGTSNLINPEGLQFVVGNCFDIDIHKASSQLYDRIYVGASCPELKIDFFYNLLAENGILILPITETKQLTIVHKKSVGYTIEKLSNVHFNELIVDTQEILISLPRLLWTPTKERHQMFSVLFRICIKNLFLSISRFVDPIQVVIKKRTTLLPIHIWIYVITFMSRDWFVCIPQGIILFFHVSYLFIVFLIIQFRSTQINIASGTKFTREI